MISIDEVNKTILELEQHDTTYATCEKLALLYIVKDHIDATHAPTTSAPRDESTTSAPRDESTTSARVVVPESYKSDFLSAASNVDIVELLNILDEHMEVVKLLHPREYESLIKKIRELKQQVP